MIHGLDNFEWIFSRREMQLKAWKVYIVEKAVHVNKICKVTLVWWNCLQIYDFLLVSFDV